MNVLVLGISGMLGHKLFQLLQSTGHNVSGVMRPSESDFIDYGLLDGKIYDGIDVRIPGTIERVIETSQPDVILNCIGLIRPVAVDPSETLSVNSLFPHDLARIASAHHARLIQLSTDGVFSGQHGNYREQNVADADDLYGKSKSLGEVTYGGHLTVRASLVGRELTARRNLLGWLLSQKGDVPGFVNAVCTPLTTIALSQILIQLLDKEEVEGLLHLGGEKIDKYSMLRLLCQEYQLSDVRLLPYSEYYVDRSLILDRMETLGFRVESFDSMVKVAYQDDEWYPSLSSLASNVSYETLTSGVPSTDGTVTPRQVRPQSGNTVGLNVGGQIPELSIIVPCFNESYHLSNLLPELSRVCSEANLSVETVILDDFIDEHTPSIGEALQPQYPELRIKVLRRKLSRRGYGAVIRYGLGHAVGKYALCIDVNGIDPLHLIPDLVAQAREGYQLVQCSRYLDPEDTKAISRRYRLYQGIYRSMVKTTIGENLTDSTYAFKLFDRTYAMGLGLTSNRFNFSPEMTLKMLLDGAQIGSIPGSHGRFGRGRPRFRLISEMWGFLYVLARASLHRIGILWF